MATTAERRAWLAGNGHPEMHGGRGRIPDHLAAKADAALGNGQDGTPGPADDWGPGAGPDDFVTADDPPGMDTPVPDDAGPAAAGPEPATAAPEERPTRPHRARARLPWHKPATRQPRQAKKHKRVSVAPLIEETYTDIASAVPPALAPLRRLLYAQAPVAGVILDPAVKDTIADRIALQPMARNYERAKVGMALVGTPAALMAVLATAPGPVLEDGRPVIQSVTDDDGRPVTDETGAPLLQVAMQPATVQHASAMLMLRYCVRAMADLSGDAIERVTDRAEQNEAREDKVDAFISFLLGMPVSRGAGESERAEGAGAGLSLAGVAGG